MEGYSGQSPSFQSVPFDSNAAMYGSSAMQKKCCLVLVTNINNVPKVISVNVLLLKIHSHSEQRRAAIFYSEQRMLVELLSGASLAHSQGLAVHYSAINMAGRQTV